MLSFARFAENTEEVDATAESNNAAADAVKVRRKIVSVETSIQYLKSDGK